MRPLINYGFGVSAMLSPIMKPGAQLAASCTCEREPFSEARLLEQRGRDWSRAKPGGRMASGAAPEGQESCMSSRHTASS